MIAKAGIHINTDSLQDVPIEVKEFEITSNGDDGRTVDISGGVVEFRFFENVLSAYMTAQCVVINTGNEYKNDVPIATRGLIDGLPLRGGETVSIRLRDNKEARNYTLSQTFSGNEINLVMVVDKIYNVITDRGKEVFVMHLSTPEFLTNLVTSVGGRYEGLISDHVYNIVNNVLKTSKRLYWDKTALNFNFYGNTRKPFYILLWLASKAIPEVPASGGKGGSGVGGAAGYFFYETRKGFNFRSIDKMFMANSSGFTQVKRKFLFNDTGLSAEGYDYNIKDYNIVTNMNLEDKLATGSYANTTIFYDFYSMKPEVRKWSYGTNTKDRIHESGDDPVYDHLPSGLKDKSTKTYVHLVDVGSNPEGTGNEQLDKKNQDSGWYEKQRAHVQNAMVQTEMRYNQLYTVVINVTIPADFALQAGDLIECNFRETTGSSKEQLNSDSSGIYMIGSVCHRYSPEDSGGHTKLGLMRDTFGRKLDS